MNQKNGNGLNSIKKIISKCCNTDNFDISEQKNDKDVLIFKICSNEVLNIDLDKLCAQDFYICFEKCTIKILRLSEKKIKINLNLFFNSCSFEEIEIYNVYFLGQFKISELVDTLEKIKDIKFNHCAFNNLILEKNKFENNICFEEKTKIKKIYLYENEFKKHFFIKKCFIGSINLWKNEFKNRCYFMDSKFGYDEDENKKAKLNFSNARFQDNVYFNNSHFYDYVDFHECEFEKITCFYGVKFYKTPNFSACYFKEPKAVNLINVDIDKLDFKSVEKYIEDNYKDESYKNETKGMQDKKEFFKIKNKHKLRYAKNLKDSFRVIKDVLITQNNTLEAQEWHKLELYAKEKENHINLSVKDREKNADIFKNILIWFNCVLLNVYRNTSDHHNDFLKILNFTVGMIVLYGVFIFFCQACIEPYSKFFNELKSSVIFIIIGILVFLCWIMFYFNRKKSIFAKSIFFIIAMVFIVLYLVTYFYKTNEYKTILYLVMCYILSIYICYFFFNIKNIIFNIVFKFMLYLVFLFFLINSSQLINPFTGVFSSGKLYESKFEKSLNDLNASVIINLASILQNDFNLHLKDQNISFTELNSAKALIVANKENLLKLNDANLNRAKEVLGEKYTELLKTINQDEITENTIKSTSVLYSIILLLCIFSLQKTARKNSIVPS
ncbi:hypothetical protein RAP63_01995 [Campylobacter coli]|nr:MULTISPECIES: hypothetical protein [Campylobacter]EIB07490.1 hypothetical protein cco91_00690 [Campylobacter coli H6]MCE7094477.1 hypothetical protein [Campylobacter coli]MCE7099654.1 hypothetical protein [Campylobacter coli]MCE7103116.1 hypothetical protein [Campylobacter coli]MCE7114579.1 hypothetical protein [Campylobacter coli]